MLVLSLVGISVEASLRAAMYKQPDVQFGLFSMNKTFLKRDLLNLTPPTKRGLLGPASPVVDAYSV